MKFNIEPINGVLNEKLQHKIDTKTKPLGALGMLEKVAFKIGNIQQSLNPEIKKPAFFVFAGDHGVTEEGISPFPQEVTFQMVMNFLGGGAAINVFSRQNGIKLSVVDAGVNFDFPPNPELINKKVAMGTKNFAIEAAMTMEQCHQALSHGAELIEKAKKEGSNVFGFGEMGIGNTTAASALFSAYSGKPAKETTGSGTGLDNKGIAHKAEVIQKAIEKHGDIKDPMQVLATFGGFEIAMICGAMLKAAELKSTILVDGFIVTSALIAASQINPNVLDYCIFSHQSNEQGHKLMLNFLNAEPLLHLDLRLGEGTGAAVALPILQSAVNFLNEMSSFEDAGVSNKE